MSQHGKGHVAACAGKKDLSTPAAPRPQLAVAPLKQINVDQEEAEFVAEALRAALTETGTFRVIGRTQMEQILSEQRFQLLGVTNESEAVQLGRVLNVREMVYGTLSKMGKIYYLTATVVSIETAEIKASKSAEGRSVNSLRKKMVRVAQGISRAFN